jgi:hypothetical protein
VASAAKNCDVLNTIGADSVEVNTDVAKWLSERPEMMFKGKDDNTKHMNGE